MPEFTGATAADIARERFGGATSLVQRAVTVGTAFAEVLGNDPKRVWWQVTNRATWTAYLRFNRNMTTLNATPLGPLGGFASMAVDEDGEAVAWQVEGAGDAAATILSVIEVFRI